MESPISNLIDYLNYRRECGERTVELEPETVGALRAMARTPAGASTPPAARPVAPQAVATAPAARPAAQPATPQPAAATRTSLPAAGGQAPSTPPAAIDFVFVGEREGVDADRAKYSETFRKMVSSLGYAPGEVPVTNICIGRRAPGAPSAAEIAAAMPAFKSLVASKNPRAIVIFGAVAARALLGNGDIATIHGKVMSWNGVKAIPTYHPAYMETIGNAVKADVCRDLCRALSAIGRPIPAIYERYR